MKTRNITCAAILMGSLVVGCVYIDGTQNSERELAETRAVTKEWVKVERDLREVVKDLQEVKRQRMALNPPQEVLVLAD